MSTSDVDGVHVLSDLVVSGFPVSVDLTYVIHVGKLPPGINP